MSCPNSPVLLARALSIMLTYIGLLSPSMMLGEAFFYRQVSISWEDEKSTVFVHHSAQYNNIGELRRKWLVWLITCRSFFVSCSNCSFNFPFMRIYKPLSLYIHDLFITNRKLIYVRHIVKVLNRKASIAITTQQASMMVYFLKMIIKLQRKM